MERRRSLREVLVPLRISWNAHCDNRSRLACQVRVWGVEEKRGRKWVRVAMYTSYAAAEAWMTGREAL